MSTLTLYADHNTGTKKDSTGAFEPEARAFHRLHGGVILPFDNRLEDRKREQHVEALIEGAGGPFTTIAIFCHGYRRGLQTGHDLYSVDELADAIARVSTANVNVVLYACSTAGVLSKTRGGFADALRDALTDRGKSGHVDGHDRPGHASINPYVMRFPMGAVESDIAGDWIVDPDSDLWGKWRASLKSEMRFKFPMMTVDHITAELRA